MKKDYLNKTNKATEKYNIFRNHVIQNNNQGLFLPWGSRDRLAYLVSYKPVGPLFFKQTNKTHKKIQERGSICWRMNGTEVAFCSPQANTHLYLKIHTHMHTWIERHIRIIVSTLVRLYWSKKLVGEQLWSWTAWSLRWCKKRYRKHSLRIWRV